MKNFIRLLAVLTGSASILAFTGITEDKTKIRLMHHSNGETVHYDTVFSASSDYSVAEFIKSKGLNPSKTEIIDLNEIRETVIEAEVEMALAKSEMAQAKSKMAISQSEMEEALSVQVAILEERIEGTGSTWVHKSVEIDDEGNEVETELRKEIDEDGNVFIEKKVNGEKLEIDEEERERIGNMWNEPHGTVHGVTRVRTGEGDEEIEIVINGKEVKVMGVKGEVIEDVRLQMIEVDEIVGNVEEILEEAEETLNESEIHIIKLKHELQDQNGNHFIFSEIETATDPIYIGQVGDFEEDFSIAIVSTIKGGASIEAPKANSMNATNSIQDLKYFPNPTADQITLSFFLTEEGQTNISIYDISGKEVYRKDLGNFQGAFNDQIDVSNLKKGTYVMNIMQNNLRLAEKLIVN